MIETIDNTVHFAELCKAESERNMIRITICDDNRKRQIYWHIKAPAPR